MAYEPHTWTDGETITAAKINNIEEGIAEAAQGGGWDAEIRIYHDSNSSSDPVLTIISGSYDALKEKVVNKQPPVIMAYIWDELSLYMGATTMTSLYGYPTEQSQNNSIVFTTKMPNATYDDHSTWWGACIAWTSNDELHIY